LVKIVLTADYKQLIKSLRQLKGYNLQFTKVSSRLHREIGHAEDLTASLQKLINMGRQKEFQAIADHTLHARLITLLHIEELLMSGSSIYTLRSRLRRTFSSI